MIRGSMTYLYEEAPLVPHLYLMPFVVVAYWIRSDSHLLQLCKVGTLAALIVHILGLSALGRVSHYYLLPLAPLLAYIGVVAFQHLVDHVLACPAEWNQAWGRRFTLNLKAALAFVALFSIFAFPLVRQTLLTARSPRPDIIEAVGPLGQALPQNKVVVTDNPWAVAWYAHRKAAWIPKEVAQLSGLEKALEKVLEQTEPIGAIYLSPALLSYGDEEQAGEWQQAYGQVQDIEGYTKIVRPQARDVVYTKLPSPAEIERMAATKPEDAAARAALGQVWLAQGQLHAALAAFREAQRLRPDAPEPYLGAGLTCLRLQDHDSALAYFQKALTRSARSLEARVAAQLAMAEVWQARGQDTRAIAAYEQALADSPDHPVALNNLAYLYASLQTGQQQNRYRALEMARRAVEADPDNGSMRDTLGWVCYGLRRYTEAVTHLQEAARLAPQNGTAHYHLGKALLGTGQPDKAADAFRVALSHRLPANDKKEAEASLLALRRVAW
jgi:tetratricopeptide (TPR) repeat protein